MSRRTSEERASAQPIVQALCAVVVPALAGGVELLKACGSQPACRGIEGRSTSEKNVGERANTALAVCLDPIEMDDLSMLCLMQSFWSEVEDAYRVEPENCLATPPQGSRHD